MAFLSQIKSKGRRYIYLTEYVSGYNKGKGMHIYSFGTRDKALSDMRKWQKDFNTFPQYLLEKGYDKVDLYEWIQTLETGVSKTGKSKKFG